MDCVLQEFTTAIKIPNTKRKLQGLQSTPEFYGSTEERNIDF